MAGTLIPTTDRLPGQEAMLAYRCSTFVQRRLAHPLAAVGVQDNLA